jgi:hypothetical protein
MALENVLIIIIIINMSTIVMHHNTVTLVLRAKSLWYWGQRRFATTVVNLATFKTTVLKDRRIWVAGVVRTVDVAVEEASEVVEEMGVGHPNTLTICRSNILRRI